MHKRDFVGLRNDLVKNSWNLSGIYPAKRPEHQDDISRTEERCRKQRERVAAPRDLGVTGLSRKRQKERRALRTHRRDGWNFLEGAHPACVRHGGARWSTGFLSFCDNSFILHSQPHFKRRRPRLCPFDSANYVSPTTLDGKCIKEPLNDRKRGDWMRFERKRRKMDGKMILWYELYVMEHALVEGCNIYLKDDE